MYKALAAGDNGNLVCSPMGLYGALGTLYSGARGKSAGAIAKMMTLTGWSEERVLKQLGVLNLRLESEPPFGLFTNRRRPLGTRGPDHRPGNRGRTRASDRRTAQQLLVRRTTGEEARGTINAWAKQHTGGLVPRALEGRGRSSR